MSTFEIKKKTLPNGLKTLYLPRDEVRSVTFLVLIGAGSRYETDKDAGLSHFLEHMFFKGTTTRPSTKQIAEELDNVGGEFNAFTGEEYTGYYVKVASSHLATGADVVADILQNPLFPEEEIEKERGVIMEEYKMYTDLPMRHVQHLWQKAQFGKHPLGRRIDGTMESVSTKHRKDFLRYTKKHYHTKNALVIVAGKFDQAKATNQLKKLFQSLSQGDEIEPRRAPARQPSEKYVGEERDNLDQTHMIVGVPGVSLKDDNRFAANLLAIILGGSMSSRLFLKVREKNGLAYMVRTGSEEYIDAGTFATQMGVRTDSADKALKMVLEEYDRVMEEEVTEEELNKAKEIIKGNLLLNLEETNNMAQFAGTQELLKKKTLTPEEIIDKYEKVTPKQIKKLAQELLATKKMTLAALGPKKSLKKLEQTIK